MPIEIKTKGCNDRHNEYIEHDNGLHEHYWYDSKTGLMGGHGENTSDHDKWWCGVRSGNMRIGK